MKKKDKTDLKTKTVFKLEEELLVKEKELLEAKIKLGKRQLKNTSLLKFLRAEIAIIKTIINEKSLAKKNKNDSQK
jgi:ribosomal protein L29